MDVVVVDDDLNDDLNDDDDEQFVRFVDEHSVVVAEVMESERGSAMARAAQQAIDNALEAIEAFNARARVPLRVLRVPLPPTLCDVFERDSCVHAALRTIKFERRDAQEAVVEQQRAVRVVASASFVNFLVTNGVVLVPRFWRPGRSDAFRVADQRAAAVLADAFPQRQVVQVDVEALTFLGGGMNCISQQQPCWP